VNPIHKIDLNTGDWTAQVQNKPHDLPEIRRIVSVVSLYNSRTTSHYSVIEIQTLKETQINSNIFQIDFSLLFQINQSIKLPFSNLLNSGAYHIQFNHLKKEMDANCCLLKIAVFIS